MKKAFNVVIIMLLIVSILENVWLVKRLHNVETKIEHDTVWKDTAFHDPVSVDSHKTERVVYIRVPYPEYLPGDTVHDSIEVPVPIWQKRYEDSLYTAWVSGYRPALDSIRLHLPEVQTTITKYVQTPAKRLAIGPSIGLGYGIVTQKPDIWVGVTATWNLNK